MRGFGAGVPNGVRGAAGEVACEHRVPCRAVFLRHQKQCWSLVFEAAHLKVPSAGSRDAAELPLASRNFGPAESQAKPIGAKVVVIPEPGFKK